MTKQMFNIPIEYTFDPSHKGANYTLDRAHWMNGGEFAEIVSKACLGYEARKDASTRYDIDSDIPELRASVKSSRFTLVNLKLADTFEATLDRYFETVHSTCWIYTVILDGEAILYTMNAEEFRSFLETWTSLNERGQVRGKHTSGKMLEWLDARA